MGEVCYPGTGRLDVVERGVGVQQEQGGDVLTSSAMYNRRDRSLCVDRLDVFEILKGNAPSANGKFLFDQVVCSLGRSLKFVSSASGLKRDSATILVNETEVSDVHETAAAFCIEERVALSSATTNSEEERLILSDTTASSGEDRVALSDATASSEIGGRFLAGRDHSPTKLECHSCKLRIPSSPMISCSHKDCSWSYHQSCTKKLRDCSWRKNGNLVCPQHVCYACGGNRTGRLWKCERCPIASHQFCCPWSGDLIFSKDSPWACWRHSFEDGLPLNLCTPTVSSLHKQRTSDTKEVFNRLPILDGVEDFTITEFLKTVIENDKEPPPYTHIRRSIPQFFHCPPAKLPVHIYAHKMLVIVLLKSSKREPELVILLRLADALNVFLIKKKRDDSDDGVRCFCGSDGSECSEDCDCRVQSMSCSKDCMCKKFCTNKPYRKEKRLKVVKTELCGWGAKAAEIIRKGEFIIEYIGEVIDDAMCEKRLWAMKGRGINNFYMCEIMKDFIIDATFKGNPSRYLNHSCQPNCKLEKWRVDGETRAGVFALRDISVGEPLTYNYKYVEFGPNVKCCCGAPNCRGAIGERLQKTMMDEILKWGKKGRRSCSRSSKTFENRYWRAMAISPC